jgi:hypothetical protein
MLTIYLKQAGFRQQISSGLFAFLLQIYLPTILSISVPISKLI